MASGIYKFLWLTVGTLYITVGAAVAGIYAFQGAILPVTVGFVLFFVGYRLSQFGVYRWPEESLRRTVSDTVHSLKTSHGLKQTSALAIGAVGIGYGVTLFSQTILDPDLLAAAAAGVASIVGYMFAHIGMNGRVL